MSHLISVNIPIAGQWPTEKELGQRNAITDQLDQDKIGKFIGAGAGMGGMDFQYEVQDKQTAKALVISAMEEHLPGQGYSMETIQVSIGTSPDEAGKKALDVSWPNKGDLGIGM